LVNKATDFSVINDTKYPTTKAANDYLIQNIAALTAYFFYNTASDISGYLQMKQPGSTAIVPDIVNNSVINGQILASFATLPNVPSITFIPNGIFI